MYVDVGELDRVPSDRVPVIDVAGRVVVGFDPDRLASILGAPNMKRALLVTLVTVAAPAVARADVFSLRVEGHAGAGGGATVSGAVKDTERGGFYDSARGGMWGFLVGAEVMFVDAWVEHHEYFGGDRTINGTWTQFMAGLDLDLESGRERGPSPENGVPGELGPPSRYLELGIGAGFGVGTGQQPELPLDNSEVSDKGFVVEGRFSAGFIVGRVIGLGVTVPVSAGYFFKSGFANNMDNQYWSAQGAVLLVVRGKIKVK